MSAEQARIISFLKNIFLFSELDDVQIANLASRVEIISLDENEVLYSQGELARSIYVIWKGKIQLSHTVKSENRNIATLVLGDYFGEDLLLGQTRNESATALNVVTILRLDKDSLFQLLVEYPNIKKILLASANSRRLARVKRYKWLNDDEIVYIISRKHEFFLFASLLVPILLIVFLVALMGWALASYNLLIIGIGIVTSALALSIGVWLWVDWGNDYYVITNKRVLWVEKVALLYDSSQEAPLDMVLSNNVVSNQTLRLLIDYGNLIIKTYTGSIVMRRLRRPALFITFVNGLQYRARDLVRQTEHEVMEGMIRQRLGFEEGDITEDIVGKGIPQEQTSYLEEKPKGFGKIFSNFLKVRYEEGDSITYRKHWFVLFKKTWWVSLAIVGLGIILIFLVNSSSLGIAFIGVWLLLFLLILVIWIYKYVDWRNDIYVVTLDHIVDIERKPLAREDKKTALLDNILSLEHNRVGIFGMMLNFGTVTINVGTEKFIFNGVYNPAQVQYEIFDRMAALQQRKERRDAAKERDRVADWMMIYHQQTGKSEDIENPPEGDEFLE